MLLAFDLPSDTEAPAQARAALAPLAQHMSRDAFDDLNLMVTELVANSVVHGPARGISVAISLDAGLVRGEIRDRGDGVVAIREAVADDDGGFGLRLVDRLADRWGVHPGSTHVWFEMSR